MGNAVKQRKHVQKGVGLMEITSAEEDVADAVMSILLLRGSIRSHTVKVRSEKSATELRFLENVFRVSSYPDGKTKYLLSVLLRMNQKTVQIWFQNRRRCLKSSVMRQVLANKNSFSRCGVPEERLYKKIRAGPRILSHKSVSSAAILRIYCDTFGIRWCF